MLRTYLCVEGMSTPGLQLCLAHLAHLLCLQKLSKESAAAFVDLLRQTQPAITSQTSFNDIETRCGNDQRWQAVTEDKRYASLSTASTTHMFICTSGRVYSGLLVKKAKLLSSGEGMIRAILKHLSVIYSLHV